ncbi:hypothetical protein BST92_03815 [Nonlabens arenilitoris]|uniref:Protein NO VEIN C-terminal domain-containing protein n=1 Tax=Nonlabens arenilitoris TaxID=1217969 RepID=A0A2S7U9N2_9FLAO|nr:DUF3883 domain-containing protein [Nonlabens arenilitoris]PQJ31104.1 hypothetical protein BST92_03815 [Nonlabens arenilitoris]
MSYQNKIQELIDERLAYYRNNPKSIARDYTIENSIKDEYDGRQLLEMLQNVDDTKSKKVRIEWDKENKTLAISNYGEAFSFEGIESLMRSHSSPKTKEDYIGNKGLGFRSLLTWANVISIYANDCKISFSDKISSSVFESQLSLTPENKEIVKSQAKVADGIVPFPVLAIPKLVSYVRQDDWQTVIEINYTHEVETKIQDIFNQISEELLLFLNHIEEIEIVIGDNISFFKSEKIECADWTEVRINDKFWRVFTKDGLLPQKVANGVGVVFKKFMIKVAFQNDLSDTYYKLFNFFPTKISVSLPCIIHGTFDLNASRDYLNPSENNKKIFKKLARFLGDCALTLSKEDVSWKPFKLLKPINNSSDSTLVKQLYTDLSEVRKTEKIIPTISDTYVVSHDVKHYHDDFNAFFKENFPDVLPELILPNEEAEINYFHPRHYDNDYLVERIDALSYTPITLEQRSELIYQLINSGRKTFKKERFSLLINDNKTTAVIDKDTVAFTPMMQSNNKFNIPKSLKIDFINSELYTLLSNKLKGRFDAKNQVSREFQSVVKNTVNVQPYDSNSIIIRIVNGINQALTDTHDIDQKILLVKEMVASLFQNFKHLSNQLDKLNLEIKLINENSEIVTSSSLFMGATYPDGELVEWLYETIYSPEQYLMKRSFWGFQGENVDEIERFFLWLGVNKYARLITLPLDKYASKSGYFNYIFKQANPSKPSNFQIDRINRGTSITYIGNIKDILLMDATRQILLILKDSTIRSKIEQLDTKYFWKYFQTNYTLITSISFIRYQFLKANKFTSYVFEDGNDSLQRLINKDIEIDFGRLNKYNCHKSEISNILVKLGAKQNIDSLKPTVLYNVLLNIPKVYTIQKNRGVQGLYKKIVDALDYQNSLKPISKAQIPKDLLLFAKKGDESVLLEPNKVFYSNNSVLPAKIEQTLPILDFPKRAGQEKAERFLGIQITDASQLKVNKPVQYSDLNNDFQNHFEILKVPLLLYRLYSKSLPKDISTKEAISQNVSYLKKCSIDIVSRCSYNYSNETNVFLEDFEFAIFDSTYYLKIPENYKYNELIKASKFSDAFAEIMSIQFNVTELKNDFRFLIRNDINDTLHLITQDFDTDKIRLVKNYFGMPALEENFWKNIYEIKGVTFPEKIVKQKELVASIKNDLSIEITPDYYKFDFEECSNKETYNYLAYLIDVLETSLDVIYPNGIEVYHFERLRNYRESNELKVTSIIWDYLNVNKKEQSKFLNYLDIFKLSALKMFFELEDKFKLSLNYAEQFSNFIESKLPIKIKDYTGETAPVKNQYKHFQSSYSFELDDLEDEIKSLFYFEGNDIKIENYLKLNYSDQVISSNTEAVELKEEVNEENPLKIIDSTLSKKNISIQRSSSIYKGTGKKRMTFSNSINERKNISGKNAEIRAFKSYKNKYGEDKVKWVSRYSSTPDNNDNLQYDLKYEDEKGVWRYVEVKSLSYDNSIIITKAEREYGIQNNLLYEFALVNNDGIHRVANPFSFKTGETFEENEFFTAEINDCKIHFKLNTK